MAEQNLIITQSDFQKISLLIKDLESPTAILLEEELGRAAVVPDEQAPADYVSMNSRVRFMDLGMNKESEVTLVYPHEANLTEHKISILAPMGAALIGLRVGQKIHWPFPNGKAREIQVLSVLT
ncbi:nucleoside diphosphate kinase regulator [Bdellovibrio sp. HCB337]|uniref:nucleoside diphosphate kinase regulator n=1 Tax=Bdellovibrio sp. HCB337 TaxID=3394358 RepID=UPI0039A4B5B0